MDTDQRRDPWAVDESGFPADAAFEDQARFLLRYAVLAPSTHNSQPWSFSVDEDAIRVVADESRWLDVADADKRELYFSVGCAVENLAVAAEHFGFDVSVDTVPDPADDPTLAARVSLRADGSAGTDTAHLFAAIPERRTNHNVYHDRPLPDEVLERATERVDCGSVDLLLAGDDERDQIADLQARADERQFDDPGYRRELGRYIGSGALGATWLTARLGQLAVTHLDLGEREGEKNSRLVLSAPVVGLVTTDADGTAARVEAGRAFERLFLQATSDGVAVHPMNQVLQVPDLAEELRELLDVGDRSVQLLFRIGYAPRESDRRPRRPVEEVLR